MLVRIKIKLICIIGQSLFLHNDEQMISGCPIDGAISVRVDCGGPFLKKSYDCS